jgi:predicted kinase
MVELTAFVMCGSPGAGKTTYAAKLAKTENAVVISGDEIRAELYGSSEIQGNWSEIWERIDELVSECCGMNIILDGTHCRPEYRAEAITLLRSYGYEKVEAVILDVSLATCLARNFKRERNVPDYVVKAMHTDLKNSMKDIFDEDFDRLNFVY